MTEPANNTYQPQSLEPAARAGNHCQNYSVFGKCDFIRIFDTNENEVFGCLTYLPVIAVTNGGEQRDEPLATDQ